MAPRFRPTRFQNVRWRGDVLYYRYNDENGQRREVRFGKGSPREARDAQEAAQERADRARAGLIDLREEQVLEHSRKPIENHIEEYRQHLVGKGDSEKHIRDTLAYIRRWARECSVRHLTQADPAQLNQFLIDLHRSARTRNAYRLSILGLLRWATNYGRLKFNPCPAGLIQKASENADRRRLSRAMTPEEFQSLLVVAPPKRRAYYLLAALTGLRWREIRRLRWGDVDLHAGIVTAQASQTKNQQRADLPLLDPVVEALKEIRPRTPLLSNPIFRGEVTLKTWRLYLQRAGVLGPNMENYVDELGRQLDRKCLRLTFATWLKDAGVDLRDAQKLLRHADPKTTMTHYADLRLENLRAALAKLESSLGETEREAPAPLPFDTQNDISIDHRSDRNR